MVGTDDRPARRARPWSLAQVAADGGVVSGGRASTGPPTQQRKRRTAAATVHIRTDRPRGFPSCWSRDFSALPFMSGGIVTRGRDHAQTRRGLRTAWTRPFGLAPI